MLLLNRKRSVEEIGGSAAWNFGMKGYKWAFKKRRNLDLVGGLVKNKMLKLNKNALGDQKEFPPVADHSFSKNWSTNKK